MYEDPQKTLRDEIRASYEIAKKADKSKCAAIKLFCIECMGGSTREAKTCESKDCFLWPHAYRRAGVVPSNRGAFLKNKAIANKADTNDQK